MTAPNELLVAARLAFLRAYLDTFDHFLPQTIENAFQRADGSRSSLEQSQYLAVYGVLRERHVELRQRLHDSMENCLIAVCKRLTARSARLLQGRVRKALYRW